MSRTPEGVEKDKLKKYLDKIGAYHFWPVPGGWGRQGVDCFACIGVEFWCIEAKAPGEEPTARQWQCMREVVACGGRAVWGTAEQIIDVLGRQAKYSDLRYPIHGPHPAGTA